jgi:carbon-monoxide dehydrogenase medium subunit
MMNFRYAVPDHLVDLNGILPLVGIAADGTALRIGAMTRQRDVEFSKEVATLCPILREGLLNVGHRQTRNRGTIGGSLCHLDPAAEMPAVMMLYDAMLTIEAAGGRREVAMKDFALGFMTTALAQDELLTGLGLEMWPTGHGYAFEEFARRHGDFAIASAGVLVLLDSNGFVRRLAVVIGGVGPTPVRLSDAEAAAVGSPVSDALVEAVSQAAGQVEAMEDAHVSAKYRRRLAAVLSRRAMERAITRASGKEFAHG